MSALHFLLDTLTSLYLGVLLLRFVMQLVRANFRNPFADAIVRLTNPLIMPLRRALPPVGKMDSATIAAILLFALFKVALILGIFAVLPGPVTLILLTVRELILAVLWLYVILVFFYGIASMLMAGGYSPIIEVLAQVCDPLLGRIRRTIPSIVGGLDLSFLWAIIALQVLILLVKEFFPL